MNRVNVLAARAEAKKFIERCDQLINAADLTNSPTFFYPLRTETGALRRQSMELTRALATLRAAD